MQRADAATDSPPDVWTTPGNLTKAPGRVIESPAPLVATALAAGLLPLLVPGGPGNTAPVDLFIAAAVVAVVLWASSGVKLRAPYALAAAVLISAGALGALAGPVPLDGMLALAQDLWLLVWAWAVANAAASPRGLRLILSFWVAASVGWAVLELIGVVTGNAELAGLAANEGGRAASTFGDPNYAANYFVVSMMVIWATQRPRNRLMRICAYGVLAGAWAFTGSNSGIVSLVVAVTAASMLGIRRRLGPVAMVSSVCVVLLLAAVAVPHLSLREIQLAAQASRYQVIRDWVGRSASSIEDRSLLLQESVGLYYQGGLLGEGPGSTKPRLVSSQAPFVKEAHDDYLAALTERGILGVVGLLLLLGSVLVRTWTIATRPLRPAVRDVVPRPNALFGAVVGTFASGTVYELLHVRHVWTLFALIAAISLWGRD
jgi:O-Antigen ligase